MLVFWVVKLNGLMVSYFSLYPTLKMEEAGSYKM
jgi:hypothetical protein